MLCGSSGGEFLTTDTGELAHHECALWVPETSVVLRTDQVSRAVEVADDGANIDVVAYCGVGDASMDVDVKSVAPVVPENTVELVAVISSENMDTSAESAAKPKPQPQPQEPSQTTDQEIVIGVKSIDPYRYRLKCEICKISTTSNPKKAPCIQCCKGKCVKAYHVTCAANAGVLLLENVYTDVTVFELYCPRHDSVRSCLYISREREIRFKLNPHIHHQRTETQRATAKRDHLLKQSAVFIPDAAVLAKWSHHGSSSYFEGDILQRLDDLESCLVVFCDGLEKIVKWRDMKLDLDRENDSDTDSGDNDDDGDGSDEEECFENENDQVTIALAKSQSKMEKLMALQQLLQDDTTTTTTPEATDLPTSDPATKATPAPKENLQNEKKEDEVEMKEVLLFDVDDDDDVALAIRCSARQIKAAKKRGSLKKEKPAQASRR